MANPLTEKLSHGILIGDGGMGTMLQTAGLPVGTVGELWNVEEPEKVVGIHRAYLEAGSDIILTNTFGGSRLRLAESGLGDRTAEINRAAAENALKAAKEFGAIAIGDIGPSGQLMEPYGEVSEEEMYESFLVQAKALVEGGVPALIVETMTSKDEMLAALRAAVKASQGVPVLASYSFKEAGGQFRTMMGESIADCVNEAIEVGASIVGTNCGMGIEEMILVVKEIRAATDRPIIAQPNAGLPAVVNGNVIYRQTPEQMVDKVPALIEAGATIVGGCCGTNPEYIRLVKGKLRG